MLAESFHGLPGDFGDEFVVLVLVQDGQRGQLGGCGDEQVGTVIANSVAAAWSMYEAPLTLL